MGDGYCHEPVDQDGPVATPGPEPLQVNEGLVVWTGVGCGCVCGENVNVWIRRGCHLGRHGVENITGEAAASLAGPSPHYTHVIHTFSPRSILTDEYMRVKGSEGSMFAFGDSSTVDQVCIPLNLLIRCVYLSTCLRPS